VIPPNDGSKRFDSRWEAVIFLAAFACFPASLLIGEPVVFG
jgi:hypothetical protein